MNRYTQKLITTLLTVCLLISGISYAKVKSVNSRRDFEQSVARESRVVALFYDEKDKDRMRMYEDVSNVQRYDDADIVFLRVNAARPELGKLAALYNITAMPTFIFFNNGKRVHDNKGVPVVLMGNVSRDMLQSCIDKHYGAEMKQYIAQKNERTQRRIAQEKESWKVYYYPRDIFVNSYGPEERNLE